MTVELVEFAIILALVSCNGLFAMSELAIVSSKRARLEHRAANGDRGAATVLDMMEKPGDFLAAIQIGITLIGVIAGAFGGATLSEHLAAWIDNVPPLAHHAENLALAIVVAAITYLSLIIGELVPKQLALQNPEGIACAVARPLRWLSTATRPIVAFISGSSAFVLWIMRVPSTREHTVTEEEIRFLINQGARTGVIEALEHEMVESVLRLDDRRVTAVMTPRTDTEWIDVADPLDDILVRVSALGEIEMPVADGSIDKIVGMLRVHDLLLPAHNPGPFDIRPLLRQPYYVPYTSTGLEVLQKLRDNRQNMAIIVDEFGGIEGTVTLDDLMEAVLGITTRPEEEGMEPVLRPDGSWLIDGSTPIDKLKRILSIDELPDEESHTFETVAGFALTQFNKIPSAGESFECAGWRFEVMDMDGQRIDKLLISSQPTLEVTENTD
ncbi:MAG: hypothetical protein AMXMBFR84_15390 [Candidatus Hydrogenedentota bacterium]